MNAVNERLKCSPISMFCGLPMMVAIDPALALQASASRNGTGFSLRSMQ